MADNLTHQPEPNIYAPTIKKSKTLLTWATFFIVYPFWTLIQNFSFWIILNFLLSASRLNLRLFRVHSVLSFAAIGFIIGSVCSTFGAGINLGFEFFEKSILVLPNYIYWGVIVIIIGNSYLKLMDIMTVYKTCFYGLSATIVSFFFLKPILSPIPFFAPMGQNQFAFILIIFAPLATGFIHYKFQNTFYSLLFIVGITLVGFLSGSRSGSLLTFLGCGCVIVLGNWIRIIILTFFSALLFFTFPLILEAPAVMKGIKNLNERTYALIYESEETFSTDPSYLTRLAMIDKGMKIFDEYPLTGIGIGNFSNKSFDIELDFEGGELLSHKQEELEGHTSTHNSYISFISEGGLLLTIPAVIMMLFPVIFFIFNYNSIKSVYQPLFIGVILMCVHGWVIAGMINVFGWFLLGIANSYIINHRSLRE